MAVAMEKKTTGPTTVCRPFMNTVVIRLNILLFIACATPSGRMFISSPKARPAKRPVRVI